MGVIDGSGDRPAMTRTACVVALLLGAALVLSSCAGDRPAVADWRDTWQQERATVPDESVLRDGGQELCDDLVGRLRSTRDTLTPTPTELLDDAVDAWISHAETLVFECTLDEDLLAAKLRELDVLAAEVDAGLAASTR